MKNEDILRKEILEKVKKIYLLRKSKEQFIPGKTKVNYSGRVFDEKEMIAVVDSALDFWLTLGNKGEQFCNEFENYLGENYCLVTNSGSSANLAAITALCSPIIRSPMKTGDEVITTAMTFPTTLNPIIQNGLIPVFIDIEEDTYNIDASKIEEAITEKTRAIVFAHTLGNPAEMDKIMQIALKYNLYVLEDTCDALDSTYDGKQCGACGHRFDYKFGDLPEGYDHKYVYNNIGYNLKPLDIQCAMGIEQLKKMKTFTIKRKKNFQILYECFKKYEDKFILPRALPKADPSWFAIPITIRENSGFTKKDFVTFLESKLIETRMLFAGNILKQPGYKNINCRIIGDLKYTDQVLYRTFFLGVYPGLTDEKLYYITECIVDFFKRFKKE
jgi:CDP-6-deoxy-D-xylo-4-hexulose-3-dehydrase